MTKAKNYQTLSLELDEVLAKLQQPDVRVDQAVTLYEQGLKLITELEKQLSEAENKIEKLKLAATNKVDAE
jgi:exodeoxyribonuclease VII small subunit